MVKHKGDVYLLLKLFNALFFEVTGRNHLHCNSFKCIWVVSKIYLAIGPLANTFLGKPEVLKYVRWLFLVQLAT
jgi:hypothetical protein